MARSAGKLIAIGPAELHGRASGERETGGRGVTSTAGGSRDARRPTATDVGVPNVTRQLPPQGEG